jgi:WD40 repeat protein
LHAQPAQPVELNGEHLQILEKASLPKVLKEASGLEMTSPDNLWTHNDDRYPILYCLDTAGNVKKVVHLNHPNRGWEDLALDDKGNLYIGSFGNNDNDRKDLRIYRVPGPETITDPVYSAEVIEFYYQDQNAFPPPESKRNFDADAFISRGDSLYIFTKNRTQPTTGYTRVYRLPNEPGRYEAIAYDSIYLGNGPMLSSWVTSADLSPDGKWLILLSHNSIWLITDFNGKLFSGGKIYHINLHHFSHKTGVAFYSNTKVFIVDELELGFIGGKLYSLDLNTILSGDLSSKKN